MADVFKALADETRRLIIDELADNDGKTLFEIGSLLIAKHNIGSTRQAISQHLAVLEEAGLVTTERRGRSKFHYFDSEPLAEITRRWPIVEKKHTMRITITSVFVDDQQAALDFYTNVLGFSGQAQHPDGRALMDHGRVTK